MQLSELNTERATHTMNSNSHGFELHRTSIKSTKLLLKVIKAIIIIMQTFLTLSFFSLGSAIFLALGSSLLSLGLGFGLGMAVSAESDAGASTLSVSSTSASSLGVLHDHIDMSIYWESYMQCTFLQAYREFEKIPHLYNQHFYPISCTAVPPTLSL